MHVAIQQRQVIRGEAQRDRLSFAGFQLYLLKSAQLLYRHSYRRITFVHVHLYGLHSRAAPRVGHVHLYIDAAAGVNLLRSEPQVSVFELRITQSVAKRIKRSARHIGIATVMIAVLEPILLRWLVIVEDRQL